jgi:putative PIN family toxin of toxin-antitoxin system
MRVLLDANLLISYLLTPHQHSPVVQTILAAGQGRFTLLMPEALLEELVRTAGEKACLAKRIAHEELQQFTQTLSALGEPIPKITRPIPAITRDPKDDYLLAYALIGQADYLVTGDNDLLCLRQVDRLRIVTCRAFWEMLK